MNQCKIVNYERELLNRAVNYTDRGEPINLGVADHNYGVHFGDGGIRCSNKNSLNDSAPFLGRTFLPGVSEAMKIYLFQAASMKLNETCIPEFTDIREKVISNRMLGTSYNVSEYDNFNSDLFPKDMTDDEVIISNRFLNRCLTDGEMSIFNHMCEQAVKAQLLYYHLRFFAECSQWTDQSAEFWKEVRKARRSCWFQMPPPTEEEIRYCGEWI